MPAQIAIVIIDLRKERLPVMLDADEIMLTPRVDLIIESIEGPDLLDDRISHRGPKRRDAGRHHYATAAEAGSQGIVQGANLRAPGASVFFLCICLTHFNLRRVTGAPTVHRRARPRLPSF